MSAAFLLEIALKSTLILGGALALTGLMRSRAAAEKGDVLRCALLLLPVLPVVALLAPFRIEATLPAAMETIPPLAYGGFSGAEATPIQPHSLGQILIGLYCVGVLALLARLAVGLAVLRNWIRHATPISVAPWANLARGTSPHVRVLASARISAPLSCGWLRPVILVDHATLSRPEQAGAVMAHERAHLARADWVVLFGIRVVTALFWFNPLVWVAQRAAEQYAEQAADHDALTEVESHIYAQTLLDCACRAHSVTPVQRIGGSPNEVARRVHIVLAGTRIPAWQSAALASLSMTVFALFVGAAEVTAAPAARSSQAASAISIAASVPASPAPATFRSQPSNDVTVSSSTSGADLLFDAASNDDVLAPLPGPPTAAISLEQVMPGEGYTRRVVRDLENAADMRAEAEQLLARGGSEPLRRAERLEDRANYLEFRAEMRRRWDAGRRSTQATDTGEPRL